MFKKLPLLVAGVLGSLSISAQTIVSTSPENRNVVLEEFTGIYCVYCPDGHARAQAIQNANPDRVTLINIHEGSFAAPSGNAPDFRTKWGMAIMNQTGLTGFPSGTVNRHVFSGNKTILDRGQWAGAAAQILQMPSYVNVGVESEIDVNTGKITVHVEAYYTGNSPQSTNFLNIALLQDNTRGPQTGGNQGNNYNHMHRLVELLTEQWGEVIETTTTGSFISRTYTYDVPGDYRNVLSQLDDLEIAAFITETTQEIITGVRSKPTLTGITNGTDAAVRFVNPIEQLCAGGTGEVGPIATIINSGTNPLSSLNIDYKINGNTHSSTWSGSLDPKRSVQVALPQVTFDVLDVNTIEVILPSDANNSNNSRTETFYGMESSGRVILKFTTDDRGSRIRWDIKDSNGAVIKRGGPYDNNTAIEEIVELSVDCYAFEIRDTQKRGSIDVTLGDHHGKTIFEVSGSWGEKAGTNFGSNGVLGVNDAKLEGVGVYPNPVTDVLNISGAAKSNIAIFDVLGKQVLSRKDIAESEAIQVSQLQAGTYFLKINRNGEITTKKFIKTE